MAGNLVQVSNNALAAGQQPVGRSGSDRQTQQEITNIGKALQSNDVAAAQSAVASLRSVAPVQAGRTDFENAVKALDQALKAGDTKGATAAFAAVQQNSRRQPTRPAPAEQTQVRQREGASRERNQVSQQDFLTRQDLAAKAASNAGPTERPVPGSERGAGRVIDTQA